MSRSLAALIVLFALTALSLAMLRSDKGARVLAAQVIDNANGRVKAEFHRRLGPVKQYLRVIREWGKLGVFDATDLEQMFALFAPGLRLRDSASSVHLASDHGDAFMLIDQGDGWLARVISARKGRSVVYELNEDGKIVGEGEWKGPYEPRERPWYEDARGPMRKIS